ncbi:uncharacterized protein CCDC198 isoform X1 [Vulpes lagopus]|uniref:uncharacterized protein CCDC198 isoform X1 n=1 Tax=Vulpes lagopus TaxID=494514 RepID=UPI001BCA1B30|nr:uncharacterized protein CCDC198 isoform X1 [Vulpes lagopus]
MGLRHSKAHPRVTRVAPLQNKEVETPSASPVDFALNQNLEEKSSYLFARLQDRNKALEGQLPPLRETWCGRYSAVPRAMYFDIPLEHGETSIIKRHPPRRLQKLEPIDLPQVITSEMLLSQQEARTTHRAKQELEKKMQTPGYTPGKRQYLHKMRMLEMNRNRQEAQAELKKSLHREARINQKPRDHKAKKILQSIPRNPRNEDGDLPILLPDETLNRRSPALGREKAKEPHLVVKENEACGLLLNSKPISASLLPSADTFPQPAFSPAALSGSFRRGKTEASIMAHPRLGLLHLLSLKFTE